MQIYQLSGRNVEVTEAMREYVEEERARIDRYTDEITDARVFDRDLPLASDSVHQGAAIEVKPLGWGALDTVAAEGGGAGRALVVARPVVALAVRALALVPLVARPLALPVTLPVAASALPLGPVGARPVAALRLAAALAALAEARGLAVRTRLAAAALRARQLPEAVLDRDQALRLAVLVHQVGLGAVLQEGQAAVRELDVLAEGALLGLAVADEAVALPLAQQPGEGDELSREIGGDLDRHGLHLPLVEVLDDDHADEADRHDREGEQDQEEDLDSKEHGLKIP